MKVCLIMPYFGKLPNYFDLWLKTCTYNPDIDFIIITDNEIKSPQNNIRVIHSTFEQLTKMVDEKIHYEVNLEAPYKLCDFKPAYGLIFQDLLEGYDFWGYCDCDLLFGDIKSFITEEIFLNHDMIQLLGHMTFIRNNNECNNMFNRDCGDINFERLSKFPIVVGFDEFGIPSIMYEEKMRIYSNPRIIADILPYHDRLIMNNRNNNYPQIFSWENGKVFRYYETDNKLCIEEIMYIHLQKRYMEFDCNLKETEYLIVPDKIIGKRKEVTTSTLYLYDKKILTRKINLYLKKRYLSIKKLYKLFKSKKLNEMILFRKYGKRTLSKIGSL